jgi:hypothetical protein
MNKLLRKFTLINLLLGSAFILVIWVIFSTFLSNYYHRFFLLIAPFSILINIMVFVFAIRKTNTSNQVLQSMVIGFAIKFFSYAVLSIIFFLIEKNIQVRIAFLLILFLIYITFSIIEINALTKYIKAGDRILK